MLCIISDANVLIDIEQGQLTQEMFSLPWEFVVPDTLFFEELSQNHGHLLQYGLTSRTMSGELVVRAYDLRQKNIRTSVNDLLALVLAESEKCQLLTGDKALTIVAKQLNVEVHGTIWLMQQMINHYKVSIEMASCAFLRMREAGSRLPWDEAEKMLHSLKSGTVKYYAQAGS